ncbi:uncharacterized protein LOC144018093 [Festucalex cinctus]
MSTDDFQTKYACFMDGVVKSTVEETTKLFETLVDELKAELSKVKTENEALKTTCRQIAETKSFVNSVAGQSGRPNVQDTAVQCDLLPCHLLLIEQAVVHHIDEKGRQSNEGEMVYILLNDHDGDVEKLPMNEVSELDVVGENKLCAVEDPPPTSAFGNETKCLVIDHQYSKEERRQRRDAQVTAVHPSLEEVRNLNEAHNQSTGPINDLTSLPTISANTEVASNAGQILASHDHMKNSPASLTASLPQALTHPLGIRSRSAMVQDAMLLIEAMNQSKPHTAPQEKPTAQDLYTRSVVISPSVVKSPVPTQAFPSQSPPTSNGSRKASENVSTNRTLFVTNATESSNSKSHIGVPTEPHRKHGVASSDVASTLSLTDTISKSLEERKLDVPLDPMPQIVSVFSKSTSAHPQRMIAPLSQNQILPVTSTVAAAQNNGTPQSSSCSVPSQGKKDASTTTAAPLDTAIGSAEQKAGSMLCKKIKIIIRKAPDGESQPQPSETQVASSDQSSVGSTVTISSHRPNASGKETPLPIVPTPFGLSPFSSPQLECSSQKTYFCESLEISLGEPAATLSTESLPLSTQQLESPSPETDIVGSLEVTSGERAASLSTENLPISSPLSSPELERTPQQTSICESVEVTPGKQAASSSTESVPVKWPLTSPQLDRPSQETNICESLERTSGDEATSSPIENLPINSTLAFPELEHPPQQMSICESLDGTPGQQATSLSTESLRPSSPKLEPPSPETNICESLEVTPGEQGTSLSTENLPISCSLSSPELERPPQQTSICESFKVTPLEQGTALSSESVPITCPFSLQLECPSQETNTCESLALASGDETTSLKSDSLPNNCPLSSPEREHPPQQTSSCESFGVTPTEQKRASPTESVPINSFPLVPVIRLKRLPNLASSTGSFSVSQLFCHESQSGIVPPDSASSLTSDEAFKSTDCPSGVAAPSISLRPGSKEISLAQTLTVSTLSDKESACPTLGEALATGSSPCTPSNVSEPVSEKTTTMEFDKAKISSISDQEALKTDQCTLNRGFVSPNGSSTTPVQLIAITEDLPEPRLQSPKIQILAGRAVAPGIQDAEKMLTNVSADGQSSCGDERTGSDGRRKSHKKSIIARLGIHLKTYSRNKRRKPNAEPLAEEPSVPGSRKKLRLDNVSTVEQDSTEKLLPASTSVNLPLSPAEPRKETARSPLTLRKQQMSTNITESKTAFEPPPVNPRKPVVSLRRLSLKDTPGSASILAKNVTRVRPTRRALKSGGLKMGDAIERVSINSEKFVVAKDGASKPFASTICPRSTSSAVTRVSKTKLSPLSRRMSNTRASNAVSEKSVNSKSSRRSGFTKPKPAVTKTTHAAVITAMPSANEAREIVNKLKAANLCLWTFTGDASAVETTFSPTSSKSCLSPKKVARVKKTPLNSPQDQATGFKTSPTPPGTKLTQDCSSPKRSPLPPVAQNESRVVKNVSKNKNSNCESLKTCNISKETTSKRKSIAGGTGPSAARSPKLAKNCASSIQTAKKSRFNEKYTLTENVTVQNAKNGASSSKTGDSIAKKSKLNRKCTVEENVNELANTAEAPPVAKIKQTKSNKAKQAMNRHQGTKMGNKCTSGSVSSPPEAQAGEAKEVEASQQPRTAAGGQLLIKNQCGDCGRVLSSSTALESHVSLHTGHRPFSCTVCSKSFPDARGLKRHTRVHRNGRMHICQQCGKGFVYGFGLNKHVQMVHGKIKPFVCQICGKAFFTQRDVETHIRTHTGERPFHCHLCERKFVRRMELNAHLRWHRGEKRHWCPYCGKGFLDQNNLKRHKYIHTGEKPHSCPHCPKHFTQSGHLKKHVKNVHKIE